jgi:hypothetical protein
MAEQEPEVVKVSDDTEAGSLLLAALRRLIREEINA